LCAWTCLFVLSLGVSMYNMYVFTKKKLGMYLSRIHNTSLISAYFGLDSSENKCLEYLFYLSSEREVEGSQNTMILIIRVD
jgi:hypothetical protein